LFSIIAFLQIVSVDNDLLRIYIYIYIDGDGGGGDKLINRDAARTCANYRLINSRGKNKKAE